MSDLKEKIKELIEQETSKGHFSVLDSSNVELIEQILRNYQHSNNLKEYSPDEPIKKAELIFVAAPTGAGKDALVARLNHQNPEKNYIELNMDIFRHYFPEFIKEPQNLTDKNFAQMTNEFAYELYYTIQELLLQEFPGTNIIITGTLRETDWVEDTFKKFKEDENTDYSVKLVCLAVPKLESSLSVIHRYVEIVNTQKNRLEYYPGTARYTTLQYHDETYERFPKSLEYFQEIFEKEPGKMIDCIEVHKRGQSIYDLDENTKIFSTEDGNNEAKTPLEAVTKLRSKPYQAKFEKIDLIMNKIRDNKTYLESQGTLIEILRNLAIILDCPAILKRLDKSQDEQSKSDDDVTIGEN